MCVEWNVPSASGDQKKWLWLSSPLHRLAREKTAVRAKHIQRLCIRFKRSLHNCQMSSGSRLLGEKEAAVPCGSSSWPFVCDFAMGTAARTLEDRRVYTGAEGWLIGEKPLPGEEGECKYSFSNLPAEMKLEQLVPLVRGRWPIEQFYEEAKQECGLDDYQGRRWDGLHRHLALGMLAYSFLMYERMRTDQDRSGSPDSCHPKRSPLPAIHRNILLWLLQDLVLWWIATDRVKTVRSPRVGPG